MKERKINNGEKLKNATNKEVWIIHKNKNLKAPPCADSVHCYSAEGSHGGRNVRKREVKDKIQ